MKFTFTKILFALTSVVALSACSATKARIDDNAELFAEYSLQEQAMIRSNRIDQGFDQTQVYLALGTASRTESDTGQETWYYYRKHAKTIEEEKTASEYRDEMYAYEKRVNAGETGLVIPSTHRQIKLYRTRIARVVRFVDGLVESWEEPTEMWLGDWQS